MHHHEGAGKVVSAVTWEMVEAGAKQQDRKQLWHGPCTCFTLAQVQRGSVDGGVYLELGIGRALAYDLVIHN